MLVVKSQCHQSTDHRDPSLDQRNHRVLFKHTQKEFQDQDLPLDQNTLHLDPLLDLKNHLLSHLKSQDLEVEAYHCPKDPEAVLYRKNQEVDHSLKDPEVVR